MHNILISGRADQLFLAAHLKHVKRGDNVWGKLAAVPYISPQGPPPSLRCWESKGECTVQSDSSKVVALFAGGSPLVPSWMLRQYHTHGLLWTVVKVFC